MSISAGATRHQFLYSFKIFSLCAPLVLSLAWPTMVNASSHTVAVNCGTGGVIQTQLDLGKSVDFSGTCDEDIVIKKDGQYLDGGGTGGDTGGIVQGTLTVNGKDYVRLEGFRVQEDAGGDDGVIILEGAHVNLKNVKFDNLDRGFCVLRHAFADIDNLISTTQTGPTANTCTNLTVTTGSVVRMWNSSLTNNIDVGGNGSPLNISRGSTVELRGNNTITNTGTEAAVAASQGSNVRIDNAIASTTNTITATGGTGFSLWFGSTMDIRHATVTSSENFVGFSSSLQARSANVIISGNVQAEKNSRMEMDDNVTINGAVTCQSFSSMNDAVPSGTGSVNCPYAIQTFGSP